MGRNPFFIHKRFSTSEFLLYHDEIYETLFMYVACYIKICKNKNFSIYAVGQNWNQTIKKKRLFYLLLFIKQTYNKFSEAWTYNSSCPMMFRTWELAIYSFVCYQVPFISNVHANWGATYLSRPDLNVKVVSFVRNF